MRTESALRTHSRLARVIALILATAAAQQARIAVAEPAMTASVAMPEPPPASADAADEPVTLMLSVSVNDTRMQELLEVQRAPDGGFSALAGDLRRFRLKLPAGLADTARVAFKDIPGLAAEYDPGQQALALQVSDSELEPYQVQLGGDVPRTDLALMRPTGAGILNYDIVSGRQDDHSYASASLEALLTGRYGVLSSTALYDSDAVPGQQSKAVRLDTRWQYIDARAVRSYIVGDFNSNALGWNNSVRLAGLQIASDFEQRADIVTAALPQFSGSAALPSTLDLYVNQQKVYSGQVPSGPTN
ncbi:MAG: hypothetical protein QM761_09910 [Pseudoxanthomonas sp.]